jgi:hypothetical protein
MLLKRHCPHTGIVNFFSANEPYLSVGFVYLTASRTGFTWHCNGGADDADGLAADLKTAEARLNRCYRESMAVERRIAAPAMAH